MQSINCQSCLIFIFILKIISLEQMAILNLAYHYHLFNSFNFSFAVIIKIPLESRSHNLTFEYIHQGLTKLKNFNKNRKINLPPPPIREKNLHITHMFIIIYIYIL